MHSVLQCPPCHACFLSNGICPCLNASEFPMRMIGSSLWGQGGIAFRYGTPCVLTRYADGFLTHKVLSEGFARQDHSSCVTCGCLSSLLGVQEQCTGTQTADSHLNSGDPWLEGSSSPLRLDSPIQHPCHHAGLLCPLPGFTASFGFYSLCHGGSLRPLVLLLHHACRNPYIRSFLFTVCLIVSLHRISTCKPCP